jgi:hypothetical protein
MRWKICPSIAFFLWFSYTSTCNPSGFYFLDGVLYFGDRGWMMGHGAMLCSPRDEGKVILIADVLCNYYYISLLPCIGKIKSHVSISRAFVSGSWICLLSGSRMLCTMGRYSCR